MTRRGRRSVRIAGIGVGVGMAVGLFLACNYHWYPFRTNYQLQDNPLRLVSAVPAARGDDGQFEPVCMGEKEATGLLLSVAILGTPDTEGAAGQSDQDVSMRPGDIVKTYGTKNQVVVAEGESVGPNNFKVSAECLERYPDPDIGGNKECQGLSIPGAAGAPPVSFRYVSDLPPDPYGSYLFTRDLTVGRVGVAVLIDQSGSMKGFVDRSTYADVNDALETAATNEGFASDPTGQRIVAVRDFLMKLNPAEKAIVFQYGEQVGTRAKVVCYDALGNTPEERLRETCYTANRDLVLGEHIIQNKYFPPELDNLQVFPDRAGRSPLWSAVADVYDFMKSRNGSEIRHILVINDGPDTCDASSPDYRPYFSKFQGVCSTQGYETFRTRVLDDLKNPTVPRVHIHFIQFQAFGYLDPDPRQQEMACLTGGHYQFINSLKPVALRNGNDWTPLQLALIEAVQRVRYSLVGVWRMALDLPDLKGTLSRGALYSLKGTITLVGQGDTLTAVDQFLYLRVGDQAVESLASLDRRVMFRLPCSNLSDCGWFQGSEPVCREKACVNLDAVCGFQAVENLQTCGTKGVCCNGWCAEGKTACQQ